MIFMERHGKREVQNMKTHTRTDKLCEVFLFKQELRSSNRTEKKMKKERKSTLSYL